jgi:hypothetical protein
MRSESKLLLSMPFDSETIWPPKERLPVKFDPLRLLAEGKPPGLGIGELHKNGIDGSGVGIAIVDQPLRLGHEEYSRRLVRYDATGLLDFKLAMHGPPVVSIAVGKSIGVAPRASLTYFAVPMWKPTNEHYISSVEQVLELNRRLPDAERIRVISISTGMFSKYPNYEGWKKIRKRAEREGVFVITCEMDPLIYGGLVRKKGADPDLADSYEAIWAIEGQVLKVPIGGRTLASHRGNDVYFYDDDGGLSWGAPYIAGLAALAFQVNPKLTPNEVRRFLVETAKHTSAGAVANPRAFIERARKTKP